MSPGEVRAEAQKWWKEIVNACVPKEEFVRAEAGYRGLAYIDVTTRRYNGELITYNVWTCMCNQCCQSVQDDPDEFLDFMAGAMDDLEWKDSLTGGYQA